MFLPFNRLDESGGGLLRRCLTAAAFARVQSSEPVSALHVPHRRPLCHAERSEASRLPPHCPDFTDRFPLTIPVPGNASSHPVRGPPRLTFRERPMNSREIIVSLVNAINERLKV